MSVPAASRRRAPVVLAVLAAALAASAPAAAAAPTIAFTPPPGAHVNTADPPPSYFRTTQTQPTIGIEASASVDLRCRVDDLGGPWQACGPPLPGCGAVTCASWRPAAPLRSGEHELDVSTDGTYIAESQSFMVDTTPPAVVLGRDFEADNPLQPVFNVDATDDDQMEPDLATDRIDCALTRLGGTPAWKPCPASRRLSYRLPRRHVDYRVWVRGTDDFGRTTIRHLDFDPVPCALAIRRPGSLRSLASSGLLVHVTCSYARRADVALYVLRSTHSYPEPPLVAGLTVRGRGQHFSFRRRLRLFRSALAPTRRFPHVTFMLTACGSTVCPEGPSTAADISWVRFTLRH